MNCGTEVSSSATVARNPAFAGSHDGSLSVSKGQSQSPGLRTLQMLHTVKSTHVALGCKCFGPCLSREEGEVNARQSGAGGGSRTPTGVATRQILSLVRLPIPPLRLPTMELVFKLLQYSSLMQARSGEPSVMQADTSRSSCRQTRPAAVNLPAWRTDSRDRRRSTQSPLL